MIKIIRDRVKRAARYQQWKLPRTRVRKPKGLGVPSGKAYDQYLGNVLLNETV